MGKIRLFGCRWCATAERIFIEILVAELHHRGSKRYITLPSHRSDTSKNVAPILEIFKMLCIISSEKALQFYHCNRTQFAEIFHVIADTADRKQIVNIVQHVVNHYRWCQITVFMMKKIFM